MDSRRLVVWISAGILSFQDMDGTRQTVYRHWVEGVELRKNKD